MPVSAKRLVATVGVAMALVAGATACSSGSSTGSSKPAPVGPAAGTIEWEAAPITQGSNDPRQVLIQAFEKAYPKIKVNLISGATDTDTLRGTLTTQISGGSSTPDVYNGDVIWPAQFAHAGLASPLSDYLPSSYWSQFAPGLVSGATYQGKIYGSPLYADEGFLYYRKDLLAKAHLPVPTTWEQLVSESKTLQSQGLVKYGFVWEGGAYEGLTCNWTEFMSDAGGSTINSDASKATINSAASVKALTFMRSLISSGVSPSSVTTMQEPQAMSTFDDGQAAFLRNWDYAYSNANTPQNSQVVGKVGVALPPTFAGQSGPGYSNVGGWNVYLNPHSKNVGASLAFIKWLASPAAQDILAGQYSEIPTNQSVRTDPAILAKNPVLAVAAHTKLIARPSQTPQYPKVSQAVYSNINAALSGSVAPSSALSSASSQIDTAVSGGGL
ncbi:ABC transporter substrate-binding protein [Streptomyces sp. RB6PN25]|uniref:ABC transporter substrate-binding protein n=1 Tax=Streptomyces humicola TaxID=2953240 RepID=A0ABT1Q4Q4_9ACTN|nr:ABC transporter substrate-binding protein [Streptomyces humicola]MCQ4084904.1 ABC transporter substrate-binding protein [Streptomyces humicola]